jgi:hypothetical protein
MVETRELEGRPHYVVPVVMLTVGTYAGSQGPIHYTAHALNESASLWNGRPVVVYHPSMKAGGYANHPEIFNRQKVGVLFNGRFDGRRLLADAWIDVEKARKVDNRIIEAIHANRVMEVSTGMTAEFAEPSIFNAGFGYAPAAARLHPDHLALLPDMTGACPVSAGAGLLRNEGTVRMFRDPALSA